MLRSNSKSLGNRVVSPEEEKERLQWEGFAEKECFNSGMKKRVGDRKTNDMSKVSKYCLEKCLKTGLLVISTTASGINDHIRFYS